MPLQTEAAGGIVFTGVPKRFVTPTGNAMTAIRDINLVVEPGQFCAIVGPTGCGKSTTLTLAAGLETPERRQRHGVRESRSTASPRASSFVFQSDALLPWKPVAANVALGPDIPRRATQAGERDGA